MIDLAAGPRITSRGRLLAALAAVAGIAMATVGLVLALAFNHAGDANDQRTQITSMATDFAVAYNTYDSAKVKDYQKRVRPFLSESFAKQFLQATDAYFPRFAEAGMVSSDARVLAVGIADLKDTSATVLVALDSTTGSAKTDAVLEEHYRITARIIKVDGTWVVDGFQNLPQAAAEQPQ